MLNKEICQLLSAELKLHKKKSALVSYLQLAKDLILCKKLCT